MDNLNFLKELYKNISEDVVDNIIMDYVDNEKYDDVMTELLENFNHMDENYHVNIRYGGYYRDTTPEERIKKYFMYVKQMKRIRKRMNNRKFINFKGKNCNDYNSDSDTDTECYGWDGMSNRCYCGKRRVDWEKDGDSETGYRAVSY
jgi:hypothetical protein